MARYIYNVMLELKIAVPLSVAKAAEACVRKATDDLVNMPLSSTSAIATKVSNVVFLDMKGLRNSGLERHAHQLGSA